MGDLLSSDPHSKYYGYFDEVTNGGKVFTENMSAIQVNRLKLSKAEVNAREKYEKMVSQLYEAYTKPRMNHPVAASQEQVLQQRVVATCLKFFDKVIMVN